MTEMSNFKGVQVELPKGGNEIRWCTELARRAKECHDRGELFYPFDLKIDWGNFPCDEECIEIDTVVEINAAPRA
jgi:hypothetical protein